MKHNVPPNFKTWLDVHDYLLQENPAMLQKNKSTIIMKFSTNDVSLVNNAELRIRVDRLKMLCFDEIQAMRVDRDSSFRFLDMIKTLMSRGGAIPFKQSEGVLNLILCLSKPNE